MDMEDEKGGDAKLIAVVAKEPRTLSMTDIDHVPQHVKAEIQQFFELYKSLEAKPGVPKWVKIRWVFFCGTDISPFMAGVVFFLEARPGVLRWAKISFDLF
jgi:hypothetical protein